MTKPYCRGGDTAAAAAIAAAYAMYATNAWVARLQTDGPSILGGPPVPGGPPAFQKHPAGPFACRLLPLPKPTMSDGSAGIPRQANVSTQPGTAAAPTPAFASQNCCAPAFGTQGAFSTGHAGFVASSACALEFQGLPAAGSFGSPVLQASLVAAGHASPAGVAIAAPFFPAQASSIGAAVPFPPSQALEPLLPLFHLDQVLGLPIPLIHFSQALKHQLP